MFPDDMVTNLISIFNQFYCRQRPTPQNLRTLVIQIAQHEFITKPLAALNSLHSGLPVTHVGFWERFSVEACDRKTDRTVSYGLQPAANFYLPHKLHRKSHRK